MSCECICSHASIAYANLSSQVLTQHVPHVQVANAEAAGAVAAVVLSDEEWLMQMGGDDENNPGIPSLLLPSAAAETLRRTLADAPGRLQGFLKTLSPEKAVAATSAPAQQDACPAGGGPVSRGVPSGKLSDCSCWGKVLARCRPFVFRRRTQGFRPEGSE